MLVLYFFFFNDTATTEIYTLSLHDALPISFTFGRQHDALAVAVGKLALAAGLDFLGFPEDAACRVCLRLRPGRSEEHTSELQSQSNLVCRLLLEKKKKTLGKTRSSIR